MYVLKQQPEDFIVKEISNIPIKDSGRYLYFRLKKKNRNTLDVVKQLAKALHIKEKQIGFAGSKDKRAITEQIISVYGAKRSSVLGATIENVHLDFLGCGDKPISLGDLQGNRFEITVRNMDDTAIGFVHQVENYFDEQRFSRSNRDIGKYLIKKQFKEALQLIDDARCNDHLSQKANDFIGALKRLPIRLLRMYVNAYQSYLWNETVARYIREKGKEIEEVDYSLGKFVFVEDVDEFRDLKVPLIGFGSEEMVTDEEVRKIIGGLMDEENIDYSDFVIKQVPELTLEGELRDIYVKVTDFDFPARSSDWIEIAFTLPKGSYATIVVKKIITLAGGFLPLSNQQQKDL